MCPCARVSVSVCVSVCVLVCACPHRQRVVPAAVRDLAADVLLRAVQPVVPVQVVGVDVRLGGGEAHAAGVALDARVELRHHALVAPVCEEDTRTHMLEHIQGGVCCGGDYKDLLSAIVFCPTSIIDNSFHHFYMELFAILSLWFPLVVRYDQGNLRLY